MRMNEKIEIINSLNDWRKIEMIINQNKDWMDYSDVIVKQIAYRYLWPSLCIFGILCNAMNLSVLTFRSNVLKESSYTYLTGLSLADCLTLIIISSLTISRSFNYTSLEAYTIPLSNMFGHISVITTVALTIERFFFVRDPLRGATYCKAKYARIALIICWIIVALIDSPYYLKLGMSQNAKACRLLAENNQIITDQFHNQHFNITVPIRLNVSMISHDHNMKSRVLFNHHYMIFTFILYKLIPLILLLVLNFYLIKIIKESNQKLRTLPGITESVSLANIAKNRIRKNSGNSQKKRFVKQRSLPETFRLKISRGKSLIKRDLTFQKDDKFSSAFKRRLKEETRLTRTLVAVVCAFLLSNLMSVISWPDFSKYYYKTQFSLSDRYLLERTNLIVHSLTLSNCAKINVQKLSSNLLLLLCYTSNFFFYVAFNEKFSKCFFSLINFSCLSQILHRSHSHRTVNHEPITKNIILQKEKEVETVKLLGSKTASQPLNKKFLFEKRRDRLISISSLPPSV
ncbi:hypothetical protein SNEBB_005933 [Seison nebaliae]|nr:hypothetical protein SNEBB_005933 [Seison nebaliae]